MKLDFTYYHALMPDRDNYEIPVEVSITHSKNKEENKYGMPTSAKFVFFHYLPIEYSK